jgi:hypothetical protein
MPRRVAALFVSFLAVSALAMSALAVSAAAAGEAAPQDVITRAIKAHGGEQRLARLQLVRMKCKGSVQVNGRPAQFTADACMHLPQRSKLAMELQVGPAKLAMTQVLDGDKAWSQLDGETEELTGERLVEQQARAHQQHLIALTPLVKDKRHTLSRLGEIKVAERPALGVRVETKGRHDVNLYFDKDSALLVKAERRALDLNQKEVQLETFYSDYRDFDGINQPLKRISTQDGKRYMELEVIDLSFEKAIEAREFARP